MAVSDDFSALIRRMDGGFIRDYSHMVDQTLLAKALKTVDPAALDKVTGNMPPEAGEALKALIARLGPVSLEEVEAAQRQIISRAQSYV